ncbi:MAG: AAA-like domain-containing protein [Microcoleaceae cyanobacterium]
MTLNELLKLMEATGHLNAVQEIILCQTWEGQTYNSMAEAYHFEADYLKKVAHKLWHLVSALLGKSISKVSFRSIVESLEVTPQQQQLIANYHHRFSVETHSPVNILEFPGYLLPLGSAFYIERPPLEMTVYREIELDGNILWIKAPLKMGKSSLLVRIMARAASQGYRTVYIDFKQITPANLINIDQFLRWLCINITEQLKLELKLDHFWDNDVGSKVSCTRYLKQYLLPSLNSPLLMGWDGMNLLFQSPEIMQETLLVLCSWYEEAKRVEIMKKLRCVLVHSTEIEIPLYPSRLNSIGLPIQLPPLTIGQMQELALRYQLDWAVEAEGIQKLQTLQQLLGGHPYLVQLAFYHLVQTEITLEKLLQDAPTICGIYREYLQHYLMLLTAQPDLVTAFKQVINLNKDIKLNPIIANQLENMGLITCIGNRVIPRCQLYQLYFATHLP